MLISLQGLRAFAATMVVFWHLQWVGVGDPSYSMVSRALQFGNAGVDIFFVLSGFIMMLVTSRGQSNPNRFAAARAIRILPFYWFFTLLFFAASGPSAWASGSEWMRLLTSLVLLPTVAPPTLGVGWSLEHETIFYAFVTVLLWRSRLHLMTTLLLTLSCIGLVLHGASDGSTFGGFFDAHLASMFQLQFLLGVLIFKHQTRLAKVPATAWLVVGCSCLVATTLMLQALDGWQVPQGDVLITPYGTLGVLRVCGYGLSGACLLCAAIRAERRNFFAHWPRVSTLLLVLGNASFILYLSHPFVLHAVERMVPMQANNSVLLVFKAAAVMLSLLFAVAFTRLVEEPVLRWLRARCGYDANAWAWLRPTVPSRPH